jgi:hypothetical protein
MKQLLPLIIAVASVAGNLHATFVYQYDFVDLYHPTKQGDQGSGYIQFLEPEGSGSLNSVYALSVTSFASPTADMWGNPLPLISATTFTLSDISFVSERLNFISWNDERLTGSWQFGFTMSTPGFNLSVNEAGMQSNFPLAYDFNEHSTSGSWVFAGKVHVKENNGHHHNVPDAGGTLALLSLGSVALVTLRRRLS